MKKILVFNYDKKQLKNFEEFELVNYFNESVNYIITDDINLVNIAFHNIVLRNIELTEYDVNRSVELYEIGLKLKGYSILSSNCMAGYFNQFICNPQIGPCAFWRFDPREFFDLLMDDKKKFLNSFTKEIEFFDRNGHYYAKDQYRTISFNHYKQKTNDEVKAIYFKRLESYNKSKTLIVLGLDRINYTFDDVKMCALKYPEAIIVTNYDLELPNVFSFNNNDEQFYLKCMKFLSICDIEKLKLLNPNVKYVEKINYDEEVMRQFNIIIELIEDVNNKREQLKILSKRLENN